MFCHKCGNELPTEAAFCNACGTKTQVLAPPAAPGLMPSGKETIQLNPNSLSVPEQPTQWNSSPGYPPASQWPNASGTLQQFGSNPGYSSNPAYPPSSQMGSSPSNPAYFSGSPTSSTIPYSQQGVTPSPVQQMGPINGVQKILVRIFGHNLAMNAWFGVVLGGIFAVVVGVIVTAILVSIAHAIAPQIASQGTSLPREAYADYALGIIPLYNLFRDTLQLFLVMHGVASHYGTIGTTDAFSFSSTFPLHGLLVVPAILLTLGGYIAASTDFQNRSRSALWRGVAIAVPYTFLLFIMTAQVNGCTSINGCVSTSPSSMLTMDNVSLFIFGLLWGGLFGLLGASIKLASGQWRHSMFQYLRTNPRPQLMGMLTGALAATGLGFALSLLVLAGFFAYTSFSFPIIGAAVCPPTGDWQSLLLVFIAKGPLYAVNLFFYSFGTPISISNPGFACLYGRDLHTSISLFGPHPGQLVWLYALLAIPVISLFLGGRVSAALGGTQGIGLGAVQGALMAVPFSVLMMLLTALSTITMTYTRTVSNSSTSVGSGIPVVASAGAGVFDVFLWALLSGAVLGAIGGIYQTSSAKMIGRTILSTVMLPFTAPGKLFYALFDRMSGQPGYLKRSSTRTRLYDALCWAILLMIAAGIGGAIVLANSRFFTVHDDALIRDIIAVVLIAIPGLFLLSACATALSRDPVEENRNNQYSENSQNSVPAMRW